MKNKNFQMYITFTKLILRKYSAGAINLIIAYIYFEFKYFQAFL
jgi:hypothetical protein